MNFLKAIHVSNTEKETVAFKKVVAPARSILGLDASEVPPSSG